VADLANLPSATAIPAALARVFAAVFVGSSQDGELPNRDADTRRA
jgi:hypothetical protein